MKLQVLSYNCNFLSTALLYSQIFMHSLSPVLFLKEPVNYKPENKIA